MRSSQSKWQIILTLLLSVFSVFNQTAAFGNTNSTDTPSVTHTPSVTPFGLATETTAPTATALPGDNSPTIESGSASAVVAGLVAAVAGCSTLFVIGGCIIACTCHAYNQKRVKLALAVQMPSIWEE